MSNSFSPENHSDHHRYTFYGEPHILPVNDTAILALLDSELHSMPQPDYIDRYSNDSHHLSTRRSCVRWIHQVCEIHYFTPVTEWRSANYFHRYISYLQFPLFLHAPTLPLPSPRLPASIPTPYVRPSILHMDRLLHKGKSHNIIKLEEKHMKILSAACLSIAVKMEETKGPKKLLNELRRLCRDVIPLKSIQKVESSVANKLSWKLLSVTPFNYIRNFIVKLPSSSYNGPDNLRIVQDSCHLILNSLMDIEILAFTPSTVAAAAVELASAKYFNAYGGKDGEDGHFFHSSVKKGKVRECICLMRKIDPR